MKRCSKCKELKNISEFGKNKSEKDGLQDACKNCRKAYYQIPKIKTKHNETSKKYKQSQSGKITVKKSSSKRRKNNPAWYKATNAVNNAIRDGKLPKISTLKCSNCPNQAHDYHHYLGYGLIHWLDVIPVCRKCHVDITLRESSSA